MRKSFFFIFIVYLIQQLNNSIKVNVRKVIAAAGSSSAKPTTLKSLLENVRVYSGNLAVKMTGDADPSPKKKSKEIDDGLKISDWTYLQTWPPNYDYTSIPTTQAVTLADPSVDAFVDYILTFNWYKNLIANDLLDNQDEIVAIIAIKDSLTKNKVKFRAVSAEKVNDIHKKFVKIKKKIQVIMNDVIINLKYFLKSGLLHSPQSQTPL